MKTEHVKILTRFGETEEENSGLDEPQNAVRAKHGPRLKFRPGARHKSGEKI